MTWALAQAAVGTEASVAGTTGKATTITGVTTGNLLVVTTAMYLNNLTPTVSDTAGNAWTQLGILASAGSGDVNTMAIYAAVAKSSGSTTVTVTWNTATAGGIEVTIAEFSGAAATVTQDGTAGTATGTGTSITTPSIVTTGASDLLIEYMITAGTGSVTGASGWSSAFVNNSDPTGYQLNAPAGTYNAAMTNATSVAWSAVVVAILGPAAAVSSLQRFLPRNTLGRGVRNRGQMALFAERIPKSTPATTTVPLWVPTYISPNGTFY